MLKGARHDVGVLEGARHDVGVLERARHDVGVLEWGNSLRAVRRARGGRSRGQLAQCSSGCASDRSVVGAVIGPVVPSCSGGRLDRERVRHRVIVIGTAAPKNERAG